MAELLIEVNRGEIIESMHRGDIAVVNYKGDLLYYLGDPYKVTYIRSAAKPLQAMNVVLSSAYHEYDLTLDELAVMCDSHYGESFHTKVVERLLSKIYLTKEHLLGGSVHSLSSKVALQQAWDHRNPDQLVSDCSGKHAGFLAVCKKNGYPVHNYNAQDHPLQKEIVDIISKMCQYPSERIKIGVDGCSVPVHALPVFNMALGYARLANPVGLPNSYLKAASTVFDAMINYPEMIAGTDGFCTELIRNTHGKLIGKIGAEGVYCVGVKGSGIGIALKMEDGSMDRIPPVIIKILKDLKLLSQDEMATLRKFDPIENLNDLGEPVGEIRANFELNKV